HACCIAFFETTYDREPCIPERGYFSPGQVSQIALDKADMPALILKTADALDNMRRVPRRFHPGGGGCRRSRCCCAGGRSSCKNGSHQVVPDPHPFVYQLLLILLQPLAAVLRMTRVEYQIGKAVFVVLPVRNCHSNRV